MSPAESPARARAESRTRLTELAEELARSLQLSGSALHQLQRGLQERRTAWIAARPSALAPAAALEALAQELAAEAERRRDLLAEVRRLLPAAPGIAAADLHVDVTRICAQLPAAAAGRLQKAAAAAASASRLVRTQLALGARQLQLSRRTHESLLTGLGQVRDDVGGYDRLARRVHGALVGKASVTGTLVDGRM
jgi:hypothetical protein